MSSLILTLNTDEIQVVFVLLLLLTKMRTTKSLLERSSDLLSFDCLSLVVAANFFVGKKVGGGAEREK